MAKSLNNIGSVSINLICSLEQVRPHLVSYPVSLFIGSPYLGLEITKKLLTLLNPIIWRCIRCSWEPENSMWCETEGEPPKLSTLITLICCSKRSRNTQRPFSLLCCFKATFRYAILVADRFEAGRRPAVSWNFMGVAMIFRQGCAPVLSLNSTQLNAKNGRRRNAPLYPYL